MHFSKIIKHKWYVTCACFRCGLIWQGLVHDISKFSPIEFFSGVKYFKGSGSPIGVEKSIKGYSEAWQHHKGRNKHHWEYWTDFQNGKIILIKIPPQYVIEMICDWVGAGKAYNNQLDPWSIDVLKQYYKDHILPGMYIHKSTQDFINLLMNHVASEDDLFSNWLKVERVIDNYVLDMIEGCAYQPPLYLYQFTSEKVVD
jgi:hypothetical protein